MSLWPAGMWRPLAYMQAVNASSRGAAAGCGLLPSATVRCCRGRGGIGPAALPLPLAALQPQLARLLPQPLAGKALGGCQAGSFSRGLLRRGLLPRCPHLLCLQLRHPQNAAVSGRRHSNVSIESASLRTSRRKNEYHDSTVKTGWARSVLHETCVPTLTAGFAGACILQSGRRWDEAKQLHDVGSCVQ